VDKQNDKILKRINKKKTRGQHEQSIGYNHSTRGLTKHAESCTRNREKNAKHSECVNVDSVITKTKEIYTITVRAY